MDGLAIRWFLDQLIPLRFLFLVTGSYYILPYAIDSTEHYLFPTETRQEKNNKMERSDMSVKCKFRLRDECFEVSPYLLDFTERPAPAVHYYGCLRCGRPHGYSL